MAAESLAKSQIEYIKVQDYIPVAENCTYKKIDIPPDLVGKYDIEIVPPDPIDVGDGDKAPFELQSITVVIKRNGEGIFTISCYRCGSST